MRKDALNNILFLDIETTSGVATYEDLPQRMQTHWDRKAKNILKEDTVTKSIISESYTERSAIYAEFNKIVCISVGYLDFKNYDTVLKVKSFFGHEEKEILYDFKKLLTKHYNNIDKYYLCGHNIKEFDCPVICRRMLVNGIEHPKLLRLSRKKPWQLEHLLDTLNMWKFGDYKSYISLDLLSAILEVPSSKDDTVGSLVSKIYWEENDLNRIVEYCQKDVVTTAKVFLKLVSVKPFDTVEFVTS